MHGLENRRRATHIRPGRDPQVPSAGSIPQVPATASGVVVSNAAITIYSTAICPYCVAAKNFLKSKGLSWTEVRIDTDPAERERMMARARRTSVPQIFIGETHVGGYDDMMALHRAGKLEPLLAGAA
jgi:glutaredoxin 3